jgi:hypothetical protein
MRSGLCAAAAATPSSPVFSLDHLEICAREQIPQDLPIVFLILDHQDALALDGPDWVSTRTGREI